MNRLLGYLVERSVGSRPMSALTGDEPASGVGPAGSQPNAERESAIRPRLPNRYERRLGSETGPGLTDIDLEQPARPPRVPSSMLEQPISAPEEQRRPAPYAERLAGEPPMASRAAPLEPALRRLDRRERQETPRATPSENIGASPVPRPETPSVRSQPAAERPSVAEPGRLEPPAPVRETAAEDPTPARLRREEARPADATQPTRPATPRALVPDADRPVLRPRAPDAPPRTVTIAPSRTIARSPAPTRPVGTVGPRQAVEPSPAPRVQVSIGRVEVRAVYAPPPAPAAPRSRPGPAMSLDDYLKQRDGGR